MASHLGIPVRELGERITLSEFLDWIAYLNYEREQRSKQDFYLAQIASEVRRSFVKHPAKVKLEDFFARWDAPERKARAQKSKAVWGSIFGIDMK